MFGCLHNYTSKKKNKISIFFEKFSFLGWFSASEPLRSKKMQTHDIIFSPLWRIICNVLKYYLFTFFIHYVIHWKRQYLWSTGYVILIYLAFLLCDDWLDRKNAGGEWDMPSCASFSIFLLPCLGNKYMGKA